MAKKIGIIGSGAVGQTLAAGFLKHGHDVMLGTREPEKLKEWSAAAGSGVQLGSVANAARFGDILVLAVKGTAAETAIKGVDPDDLWGKVVIDTTNPITDAPPTNGVLGFFTNFEESLMERLQNMTPGARFVKAFSSVGYALMVNPNLGTKPSMFICGNDVPAKTEVAEILDRFGWEIEDMGTAEAARAIEPLCILWCIPGFLHNDWVHAYKVLRPA